MDRDRDTSGRTARGLRRPERSGLGHRARSKHHCNRLQEQNRAFLLAFLLGGFGAHKFYLGHVGLGILYIVLTLTLIGILFTGPAALIESIIYVTKSDEDFERIYVQERKAWF